MKMSEIEFRRLFMDYLTEDEMTTLINKYIYHKNVSLNSLFLKTISKEVLNEAKQIIISKKLSDFSEIDENDFIF